MDYEKLKSWPFDEAKKLLKRINLQKNEVCVFETGYGPSGLPHIGTFAEVVRTSMVIKAIKQISDIKTKLIVFSDDMDGLRKVPENIPNKDLVKQNINKPLSSIPDPFKKFESFAQHNNNRLKTFLNRFNFEYDFKSSTALYKSGFFNDGLVKVLENYAKIRNTILPTLGKERRQTYSPFLPISETSGKVLEVKIENIDVESNMIEYIDPDSRKITQSSILDGKCKLQWKVDWAMRWMVLCIDYEMNGKDLIESFQLSSKINKIIGGKPPNNLTYELFLDANGEKISKSIGNGISVDDWLEFSPQESLEYFMFQSPRKAKRLFFDVIPRATDDYIRQNNALNSNMNDVNLDNPAWFICKFEENVVPEGITFNMILNLASVCNAENSNILWGFIENYYPNLDKEKSKFLNKLLEYGVNYYKKFILPKKKYKNPSDVEKKYLKQLIEKLEKIDENSDSEEIQNILYEIGNNSSFENLKDWFKCFYEVILGQSEGPRIGSFIKFYGLKKTIDLLKLRLHI